MIQNSELMPVLSAATHVVQAEPSMDARYKSVPSVAN